MTVSSGLSSQRHRQVLWTLLIVAALLRLIFVFETPAWHAPDEYAHYWVAQEIAATGSLPQSRHAFPEFEAFQPPLYYVLAALPLRLVSADVPFEAGPMPPPGPLVLLRLLSVILATATLWSAYRLFRLLPGLDPDDALWALAFMAFLPTFVGSGATVSNDALVVLPATLCLGCCFKSPWTSRTAAWAGLWAGLALLTKMNGLVLLPIIVWQGWHAAAGDRRLFGKQMAFVLAGGAIPAFLLVHRNVSQYDDITALNPGVARAFEFTLSNSVRALRNLTWSFWLALGRGYKVQLPPLGYVLTALPLMILAGIGLVRVARKRAALLIPAMLAVATAIGGSLWYTFSYPAGTMTSWGKNLFPVLPLIAVLMTVGWKYAWPHRPGTVPALGLALLVAGALWGVWRLGLLI